MKNVHIFKKNWKKKLRNKLVLKNGFKTWLKVYSKSSNKQNISDLLSKFVFENPQLSENRKNHVTIFFIIDLQISIFLVFDNFFSRKSSQKALITSRISSWTLPIQLELWVSNLFNFSSRSFTRNLQTNQHTLDLFIPPPNLTDRSPFCSVTTTTTTFLETTCTQLGSD